MKSFLKLLVLVPLGLILVAFAVANRESVTVSFDPFSSDLPAFALSAPLFVVLLIVIALGVIVGGVATWFTQARHRKAGRSARRELTELQAEVERLKTEVQVQARQAATVPQGYAALPGQTAA